MLYKSLSFRGDRIQWNVLGQRAASGYENLEAPKLKSSVLVLPNHQHDLKMGTELFPETSENPHILTRLSSRETFIE
jgi:hypothetical protein